jgi:hypothetical protein
MIDHGFVLAEGAEAEIRRLSLCKITPPASIVTIKPALWQADEAPGSWTSSALLSRRWLSWTTLLRD